MKFSFKVINFPLPLKEFSFFAVNFSFLQEAFNSHDDSNATNLPITRGFLCRILCYDKILEQPEAGG